MSSSLSVLHVSHPTVGGVAVCVEQLAADQVSRGWDVTVACPSEGVLAERVEKAGARRVVWEFRRKLASAPIEGWRLGRLIRRYEPDVVHLHSHKAGFAGRLAIRGRRPTIFHPNSFVYEEGGTAAWLSLHWERIGARWTTRLISVSDGDRARATELGIHCPTVVIHNAVDTEHIPVATDADRVAARARLGLPGAPLVVSVGRFMRQKGQDVLLDGWGRVRAAVPDAHLALVGDGPDGDTLRARSGPEVIFPGWRDDVDDWLAAADVVALPSRWEGMAYVPMEAMARGRTLVAADVAGIREAIGDEAGAIVPIEDPAALAGAIAARLLDRDLAAREGAAGRARVERRFSVAGFTSAVAELTMQLAAERPRP